MKKKKQKKWRKEKETQRNHRRRGAKLEIEWVNKADKAKWNEEGEA